MVYGGPRRSRSRSRERHIGSDRPAQNDGASRWLTSRTDTRQRDDRLHRSDDDDQEEAPRYQQIAWGRSITGPGATPETILTLFEREGRRFEARTLATTVHRVGKFGGRRVRSDRRLEPLAERCRRRMGKFNSQDMANTAWGFAKTGFIKKLLFDKIAATALRQIGEFNSQELANTIWAFAKGGVAAKRLFDAVAKEALGRLAEFNVTEMSMMSWALATACVAAGTLFKAMAGKAANRLHDANAYDMANMVWAFATADVEAVTFFKAIAAEAPRRIHEFTTRDVESLVWGFATTGVAARNVFEAIAVEALWCIREFNPEAMANVAWAYATADVRAEPLFEAIAREWQTRNLRQFTSKDIAKTVWGFATAGFTASAFFEALAVEAEWRSSEFNAQDLATAALAFATAGIKDQPLFEAIAVKAVGVGLLRKFNAQDLAKMLWAFACIGWKQNQLFRDLGSALMGRFNDLNDTDKSLLYLVPLYVQLEWPDLEFPLSSELQSLRSAYTRRDPGPSQRDVSAMLTELGWTHVCDHVTQEGIALDFADPETKRGIQVDGPSHCLRDVMRREYAVSGSTQFKAQLLRALGWQITHLPVFGWADKTTSERRELLQRHLAKIRATRFDKYISLDAARLQLLHDSL